MAVRRQTNKRFFAAAAQDQSGLAAPTTSSAVASILVTSIGRARPARHAQTVSAGP
jgi:hypothetical protein